MCGIFGIVANSAVNQTIFDALTVLQHRGQDAAGIATVQDNRIFLHKKNGLVRDVFHTRHMRYLSGNAGIGHVRYPTAGRHTSADAQPFYVNSPFGIVLSHNGNLTNTANLRPKLLEEDLRHLNTNSDSEVLLNVLAHEIQLLRKINPSAEDIFGAVQSVFQKCKGGYAVVSIIAGKGLLAFRDPFGIRPLCYGKRTTPQGLEYAVASESVALDAVDFEFIGDIPPRGVLYIPLSGGEIFTSFPSEEEAYKNYHPCVFEYVYLARPDSIIDGVSVYKARLKMGELLAKKIQRTMPNIDLDVVIPIPDSGRTAAIELAYILNAKFREGFIKNRYIGRTFIMPGQEIRKKSVRQKLNTTPLEFKGKNVLLVDDSIVRGTTSKQIIQMARDAGAKKVYFASAAPPVRFPNVYGIDLPERSDLIAHGISEEDVAKIIGADAVFYQDLSDLILSIQESNPKLQHFDASCFDGKYISGDIDDLYLKTLEDSRGNKSGFSMYEEEFSENPITLL
jgi:amidophosphoribosyltransferase